MSISADSSTSATQVMVKYNEGSAGIAVSWSKSCQKIVKKSKNLKSLKICKGHWFKRTFIEVLILYWFIIINFFC